MTKLNKNELNVFFDACNLPIQEQQAFIQSQCHSDIKICNEISSLVKSYNNANTFFDEFATDILGTNINEEDEEQDFTNHDPYKLINKKVCHFKIKSQLGMGGMGVVYLAKDQKLNRLVALKFLPQHLCQDTTAIQRFAKEAQMASTVDNQNIGTIYSVEKNSNGYPFIVMAYYQGQTLDQILEKRDLSTNRMLDIMIQICKGLGAAHKKNIIHRDIKPSNIIILSDGCVKILDFGLAKLSSDDLTTSHKMGTLAYMSPEHFKGEEITTKSDLWSLGVVFYQLIAGCRPFTGVSQQAVMYSVLNDIVNFNRLNSSYEIKKIISSCLQRTINKRAKSINSILLDLEKEKQIIQNKDSKPLRRYYFHHHWLENLVFNLKQYSIVIALLSSLFLFILLIVKSKPTIDTSITNQQQSELPTKKHIAITILQQDLSTLESGLLNTVSQSLLTLSNSYSNIWVIPESKPREYEISDLSEIKDVFGVNLIINASVSKTDNRYIITLELIDAKTLKIIKKQKILQLSSNLAIFQETVITKLLTFLELPQHIPQSNSTGETSNPAAYQSYTQGLGVLQRIDKKENYAIAIEWFNQALEYDPKFVAAYIQLAQTYWLYYKDTQNIDYASKAETLSEKALTIKPDSLYAFINLGKIHNGLGRYGTALASYQLALKQNHNNTEVLMGLAQVYENLNKLDLAEKHLIKAVTLKPDYWLVFNKLGVFYLTHGEYYKAIEQFETALQLTPANAWIYSNLGTSYWYLGNIDKTIAMFQNAIKLQEDYSIYSNLATLYFYQHDYHQSKNMYQKALALDASDFRVWGNFALVQILTENNKLKAAANFKHALDLALKHLAINRQDIEVITNVAAYYAWLEDKENSLHYISKAIKLSPNDLEVFFQIAATYEKLAMRDDAIIWLKRALNNGYSKIDIINYPFFDDLKNDNKFKNIIGNKYEAK